MTARGSHERLGPAVLARISEKRRKGQAGCLAMYSSWFGGVVTDPGGMFVPVDDHLVHRGDGVFETIKCIRGALYNLRAHLSRLRTSADAIGLPVPVDERGLVRICCEVAAAAGRDDCQIRLLISRGPGSLSVSPAETLGSQIYAVAAELPPPYHRRCPGGARAVTVEVASWGSPFLARIKTCNYLPNVLMKKAALERGAEFPIGVDEHGRITEGATENIALITPDRWLVFPSEGRILPGTTADRVADLVQESITGKELRGVRKADILRGDLYRASEVLALGTTIDVAPIVEVDGRRIGDGTPGAIAARIAALLEDDQLTNAELRTPVRG
ncbi:MAG TPA: peptidase [Kiritimatiellae bacterium]|nr:peptidase [Kiritimatiellia bacterium]